MEIKDILIIGEVKPYIGYQLQTIYKSGWTPDDMVKYWKLGTRKLKNIPAKISRFLDKTKIKTLWKTTFERYDEDNYYFILTHSGEIFEVHY